FIAPQHRYRLGGQAIDGAAQRPSSRTKAQAGRRSSASPKPRRRRTSSTSWTRFGGRSTLRSRRGGAGQGGGSEEAGEGDQESRSTRAATDFDYAAAAELFLTKRSGGPRGRLGYRRFASAAEAIRFAIEEPPAARILGVFMQVGDLRYDADGIRLLYQRHDYPLERSRADRGA